MFLCVLLCFVHDMDTIWIDLIKYRSLNSVDLSLPFKGLEILLPVYKRMPPFWSRDATLERRISAMRNRIDANFFLNHFYFD